MDRVCWGNQDTKLVCEGISEPELLPGTLPKELLPELFPGSVVRNSGRNSGQELWPGNLARKSGQGLWPGIWPGTLSRNSGQEVWPGTLARDSGQELWPATQTTQNVDLVKLRFQCPKALKDESTDHCEFAVAVITVMSVLFFKTTLLRRITANSQAQ